MEDLLERILGEDKLLVQIDGVEYPIRSMDSLSPREFWLVMARGREFSSMNGNEIAARQAEVVQTLDQIYKIIAPDFPRYKPSLFERIKRGYIKRFALSLPAALSILQAWIEMNDAQREEGESGNESQADWDDVFSEMSYWYHIPYGDVRNMPMSAIRVYMQKLKVQRAATRLMLAESASVPHMTKDAHRDWHAEVEKILNGGRHVVEVLSPAVMSMIGIGFTPRKEKAHG